MSSIIWIHERSDQLENICTHCTIDETTNTFTFFYNISEVIHETFSVRNSVSIGATIKLNGDLIVLDLADAGDHAAVELNHDELTELKGQFECL